MPFAAHRDRSFLHRFEKCGLRLWRCPVNFIGEDDVGEDWSTSKLEHPTVAKNIGSGDIGWHHIGSELNSRKIQRQRFGKRLDQQSLAEAGHSLQQEMAIGGQTYQD